MTSQRVLVPAFLALPGAALVATAALYVAAVHSLASSGPNPVGYGLLEGANNAVVTDAVLLSAVGVLLVLAGRPQRVVGSLLAAATVTLGLAGGLEALGSGFAGIEPSHQPQHLYSLLLAVEGTGSTLMPAPFVFAAAALVSLAIARHGGRRAGSALLNGA